MSRNVQSVGPTDTVALALQIMMWGDFRHLPVVRGGDLVGMISDRDLAGVRPDGAGASVADFMTRFPQTTHPDEEVEAAALRMTEAKLDALPVTEDGRVVGVVTSTDIVANTARQYIFGAPSSSKAMTVDDVMTREPASATPDESLRVAIDRMSDRRVRHLPIVDENSRVVGIVSERDVLAWMAAPDVPSPSRTESARRESIASLMSTEPLTVASGSPLGDLIWPFVTRRVGAVPIVDEDGRLLGIVSYLDLLQLSPSG